MATAPSRVWGKWVPCHLAPRLGSRATPPQLRHELRPDRVGDNGSGGCFSITSRLLQEWTGRMRVDAPRSRPAAVTRGPLVAGLEVRLASEQCQGRPHEPHPFLRDGDLALGREQARPRRPDRRRMGVVRGVCLDASSTLAFRVSTLPPILDRTVRASLVRLVLVLTLVSALPWRDAQW